MDTPKQSSTVPAGLAGPILARVGIVCLLLAACAKQAPKVRDVVLITLDTVRADALGCYGAPGDPTPHLDRLASSGVRFEWAYSTSALTPVSHASILTGLAGDRHGLQIMAGSGGFRLGEDIPTLATQLGKAGLACGAVHSAFPVAAHFGFERGFSVFESFDPTRAGTNPGDVMQLQRRSDETTRKCLEFLASHPEPSFLWVHYWDPHDALLLPPPEALPEDLPRNKQGRLVPSPQLYAAEMRYLDRQVGRLLAGLEGMQRLDQALIVVVADHGEGLGDHGWWHHRTLYQEQMRVPLIVRAPGAKSRTVQAAVSTLDLAPTVLDWLNLAPGGRLDGVSLRPWMEGGRGQTRAVFAEQHNGYDHNAGEIREQRPQDDHLYAVIDDGFKLLYRPHMPQASELFDLRADPLEKNNLFPAQRQQFVRLARILAGRGAWLTAPPEAQPAGSSAASASVSAALAALGYTGGAGDAAQASWRWVYTCPEHDQERWPKPTPCARCNGAPLLTSEPSR